MKSRDSFNHPTPHSVRVLGMLAAVGMLSAMGAVACAGKASTEDPPLTGGAPTFEAQAKLVAGIEPVAFRSRFRRKLSVLAEPQAVVYPPYDLSNTDAAKRGAAELATIQANLATSDWSEQPAAGKRRVVYTDLERGEEWEQEFEDAEIDRVRRLGELRGVNLASTAPEETEVTADQLLPGPRLQAWSNGVDSRVIKPINSTYPTFDNILMRMGQLNRSCSATLVGRRLVLTAGHCVVNADLSQTNQVYRARASGSSAPFGAENTAAYWWDGQYGANNCQTNYTAATREVCGKWDWALLLLRSDAWTGSPNGTPSWMGYWAPGQTAMQNNAYARNDGYPGCGSSDAPSGCTANTVYGETVGHTSVLFRGPDPGDGNYPLIFQTSNDTSPGHSGGPIWSNVYPNTTGGPYVLAIYTNLMCGQCIASGDGSASDKANPTMVRSMSPWLGGFINTQRVNFP